MATAATTTENNNADRDRSRPRSKNWCFTLNNYTEVDLDRLSSLRSTPGLYLIYGKEVGETGTPHLQGFVSFPSRKRMTEVIAVLGQCHCSIARFLAKSIEYCKKEGDFTEFGEPPSEERKAGIRNDLEAFKTAVKEAAPSGGLSLATIREDHSTVYARYRTFVLDYLRDHQPLFRVPAHPLRDWQEALNGKLILPPDPREIVFVVDYTGNKGKSWFMRYYEQLHPDNTQIIIPGKKQDMAFVVQETSRVFFFDCPRSKQGEFIQYDFLEEVKNGYVFSCKYESRIKRFETPHVVVAMNEYPDMHKLSSDRYNVIEI